MCWVNNYDIVLEISVFYLTLSPYTLLGSTSLIRHEWVAQQGERILWCRCWGLFMTLLRMTMVHFQHDCIEHSDLNQVIIDGLHDLFVCLLFLLLYFSMYVTVCSTSAVINVSCFTLLVLFCTIFALWMKMAYVIVININPPLLDINMHAAIFICSGFAG